MRRTLVIAGGILLVVAVIALFTVAIAPAVEPIMPSRSALAPVTIQAPGGALPAEGTAIVERPLFWQSRRPYVPPVATAVAETTSDVGVIKDMNLAGIFASGVDAGVIVTVKEKRHRLRVGEDLEGWELVSLTPGSATFIGQDRANGKKLTRILELRHQVPESGTQAQSPSPPVPDGRKVESGNAKDNGRGAEKTERKSNE